MSLAVSGRLRASLRSQNMVDKEVEDVEDFDEDVNEDVEDVNEDLNEDVEVVEVV